MHLAAQIGPRKPVRHADNRNIGQDAPEAGFMQNMAEQPNRRQQQPLNTFAQRG